ncbi:hypothetical protein K501DRAFT_332689 [Backusella circina FSU 941]|nr:hypothetical protein K501DRAFT_332689 [Backusella circina FSU 941]
MDVTANIQSYPHVTEYRRTSSISSQDNKQPQQESPISDSYCSCCCSSFEEEEHNSSSTICTTPIDTTALSPACEDNDKSRGKKVHAIEELLQTERDYVQDLSHLVEICLKVLSRQTWISQNHKHIIVRNAHAILRFHKQFILTFDTASLWNNWSCIAQTFLDQMENFKLYTTYCDKHAEAWSLCSKYRERPEWTGFLKECVVLDSHSIPFNLSNDIFLHYRQQSAKRLQFEDYLIKPVQRICRYQLLIKEIIRYSSTRTTEYELWNLVLDEMKEIVSDIDRRKYERDMKERTDKFIERMESDWRITKSQLHKLNYILISGAIEVTYSALGSGMSKPRYLGCFIFATYLIMVRPKKNTSYEPKHWFPLRLTEFEDLNDIPGQRENSFIVKCRKHTFIFTATCGQEKQLWTTKLEKAIYEAKNKPRDNNSKFSPEDFIISSLSGIGCKSLESKNHHDIRPSKSFSTDYSGKSPSALSTSLTSSSSSSSSASPSLTSPSSLPPDIRLRRSMSTHIQFEDALKTISLAPHLSPSLRCLSNKRYSADCTNIKRSATQCHPSESFIGLGKRRPSSVDLLSTTVPTTVSNNRISRMSLQFKNNQMNAIKITVDHKLRDVCTQDYLSLRAWYMRERDQIAYYQKKSTTPIQSEELSTCSGNANVNNNSNSSSNSNSNSGGSSSSSSSGGGGGGTSSGNSRKLSTSFLRTSASSLSLMIPKRTGDVKTRHSDSTTLCSSSLDHLTEPSRTDADRLHSREPTTIVDLSSNTLFKTVETSTTRETYKEVKNQGLHPLQLPSSQPSIPPPPNPTPPPQIQQERILERKKSSGRIIVNKALQRMKSFRYNNKKSSESKINGCNVTKDNEDLVFNSKSNDILMPVKKIEKTTFNGEYTKHSRELESRDRQIFKEKDEGKECKYQNQGQLEPVKTDAFAYASTPPAEFPKKRSSIWRSKLRTFQDNLLLKKEQCQQ